MANAPHADSPPLSGSRREPNETCSDVPACSEGESFWSYITWPTSDDYPSARPDRPCSAPSPHRLGLAGDFPVHAHGHVPAVLGDPEQLPFVSRQHLGETHRFSLIAIGMDVATAKCLPQGLAVCNLYDGRFCSDVPRRAVESFSLLLFSPGVLFTIFNTHLYFRPTMCSWCVY